jgi:hypothetical protein
MPLAASAACISADAPGLLMAHLRSVRDLSGPAR